MQFTAVILATLLSVVAATPAPKKGGLPGSPNVSMQKIKQQCQGHQANIRCCNLAGGNNGGNNKFNIQFDGQSFAALCNQDITNAPGNQQAQSICSVTIACCIGDGCIAIADGNINNSGSINSALGSIAASASSASATSNAVGATGASNGDSTIFITQTQTVTETTSLSSYATPSSY